MEEELSAIRNDIDQIDSAMIILLNKRLDCALRVGEVKKKYSAETKTAPVIYRPEREAQIFRRIIEKNPGPMSNKMIFTIFRDIISACRNSEARITSAVLGPTGTFTEKAAHQHFGPGTEFTLRDTITGVFDCVSAKSVLYGVVPLQNTLSGTVVETANCFASNDVKIVGEVLLRINHCLASKCKDLAGIEVLFAHPQSFQQCANWIKTTLPHARVEMCSSNAISATKAANTSNSATIASRELAALHNLDLVAESIQNDGLNLTQFVIISPNQVLPPSGRDKTAILITGKDIDFGFIDPLESIKFEKIPNSYFTLLQIQGHASEMVVQQFIEILAEKSIDYKFLGSFPEALSIDDLDR